MTGVCYRKNHERGLWFEIQTLEDRANALERRGEDASFERELIEEYKKYRPEDYDDMLDMQS